MMKMKEMIKSEREDKFKSTIAKLKKSMIFLQEIGD